MLSGGEVFAGRYKVLGRIAHGGMGVIYAAEHLTTEERVALKVLQPNLLASQASVESFQLEARMTARVRSDYIVRVLDAGVDDKNREPYLVMELLSGVTLRALVEKRGPLPPAQAVVIVRQLAKALDRAHGHVDREGRPTPVVHRDLKPENIFVALHEGAAVVKVLDFGIAKVLSENTEQSRELRGTPAFMAYEQFSKGPVTPRLDVWALGLIVFYLLTGRKYWLATAKGAGDFASLLGEILTLPFARPTERAREFGLEPDWSPGFDQWFFQCVNRDIEARFGSAGAAAAALESALASGGRLSKAEVSAARSTLARNVERLLEPAAARQPAAATGELTGFSTDEAVMDVVSAEVHSLPPAWRAPSSPGADVPAPRLSANVPAPRPSADVPAPRSSNQVPTPRPFADVPASRALAGSAADMFESSSTADELTAPFAPRALRGGASPPRGFEPRASSNGSSQEAAPEPALPLTGSTDTWPLGTVASNVARESPTLTRHRVLAFGAASLVVGAAAMFAALTVVNGSSRGRTDATSVSSLSGKNNPAGALSFGQLGAGAEHASAPDAPAAKVADVASMAAELAAATTSVRAPQTSPPAVAEKRPETANSKKASDRDPSPEAQSGPPPDGQRPVQAEVKKGEVVAWGGGLENPYRKFLKPGAEGEGSPSAVTTGILNLNSIPPSTCVIDGKTVGLTPRSNVPVSPGSHSIVFTHPEHGSKTVTVTLSIGETKSASVRFP